MGRRSAEQCSTGRCSTGRRPAAARPASARHGRPAIAVSGGRAADVLGMLLPPMVVPRPARDRAPGGTHRTPWEGMTGRRPGPTAPGLPTGLCFRAFRRRCYDEPAVRARNSIDGRIMPPAGAVRRRWSSPGGPRPAPVRPLRRQQHRRCCRAGPFPNAAPQAVGSSTDPGSAVTMSRPCHRSDPDRTRGRWRGGHAGRRRVTLVAADVRGASATTGPRGNPGEGGPG